MRQRHKFFGECFDFPRMLVNKNSPSAIDGRAATLVGCYYGLVEVDPEFGVDAPVLLLAPEFVVLLFDGVEADGVVAEGVDGALAPGAPAAPGAPGAPAGPAGPGVLGVTIVVFDGAGCEAGAVTLTVDGCCWPL